MQKTTTFPHSARLLAGAAVLTTGLGFASSAEAQVIVTTSRTYAEVASSPSTSQFVTVSGTGTINPTAKSGPGFFYGYNNISTFEGLAGYRTIQTFPTPLHSLNTAKALDFTGAGSRDIVFSSSHGTGTSVATAATYVTSTGNAIRIQVPVATTFTLTLNFGELGLDPNNATQNILDQTNGARAVGFTLTGNYARLVDATATVNFYSNSSALLSSQVLNANVDGNPGSTTVGTADRWAFVSWQNTTGLVANDIARVTISFTTWASGGDAQLALDDLGYTTSPIPEPASAAALLGLGALGCVAARRRRR